MTAFCDPGIQNLFVDQALDSAHRQLEQLGGFAGAAASRCRQVGHRCLFWKNPIYL